MKPSEYKKYMLTLLLWALLLCCCQPLSADLYSSDEICYLNKEKGLSGESVSKIITDSNGQVWMLTSYGINRYNGKRVEHFRIKGADNHLWASDMCLTKDGDVFLACRAGLYILRRGHDAFTKVKIDVTSPENLLYADHRLYIGCHDGLYIYDGSMVKHITVAPLVGLGNSVRQSVRLANGTICFVTREAVNFYYPKSSKVRTLHLSRQLPAETALTQVAAVGDNLYLGTKNNGLYVWNVRQRKLRRLSGVGNVINSLGRQGAYNVSVATDGSGAYLLDGRNGRIVEQFNTKATGRHHTPTNAVYCYYRDVNGVNWLGYARYGASYTYHSPNLFFPYRYRDFTTEGLDVRSFCLHGSEVLVGTYDGLYYIDEQRGVVKHFTPELLGGAHIVTDIVWFDGRYVVSTYDGGILQILPQSLTASPLPASPLLHNAVGGTLRVSPDGRLWICTNNGLFILDRSGKLIRYTEDNAKIYGGLPTSILFDHAGKAWLTFAKGISLYNTATGQFGLDNFPTGFFNKEAVIGCQVVGNRLLFFGRHDIYYTDASMQHFGQLAIPASLVQEGYKACLQDAEGCYWLVSDLGLFRYSPGQASIQHFSYGEGVRSQIVNNLKQDGKGRIWLATSNGLLCVSLKHIARWMRDARFPVVLYDIRRGGEYVEQSEEENINSNHEIDIAWNIISQLVTFKPILEDYARPTGRIYEYQLDGGQRWRMIPDGHELQLGSLFLGNHRLSVRLAGAPGTERVYVLRVRPSALAWMEFVLLIVGLVLFVLWRRYRKNTTNLLDERNEIADALVEVEDERRRAEDKIASLQEMTSADDAKGEAPKYEHVKLDEEECEWLVAKMKTHIEKDRVFTNPNLKLGDLADYLHISTSRLSQIFRLYMHVNYYDFINAYRLEEFKRLVGEGKDKQYTITALSEQCGFKRSNFFSTFRKSFGMTPVEYLKKMRE